MKTHFPSIVNTWIREQIMKAVTAPATPAANQAVVYVDSADGLYKIKMPSGNVIIIPDSAFTIPTSGASGFTASRVIVSNGSGNLTAASVTSATLAFLDATSSIQTQLNGKQASLGYTAENVANKDAASGYPSLNASSKITASLNAINQLPALTPSKVIVSDGSGFLSAASVTAATLAFLDATSSIQTQLNGKQPSLGYTAENVGNKGSASGYADLDSASLVPSSRLRGTPIFNNMRLTGFGANTTYISMVFATTQNSATETAVQVANPSDNSPTWKKLMIKLSSNSFNGTMLFRNRKNAADGSLSITINASATGLFYDSTNSDTLSQGDLIAYVIKQGTANTGSGNIDYVSSVIT